MAHAEGLSKEEAHKEHVKKIWRTFWILLAATAVEFIIALGVGYEYYTVKVIVFITLTIVKAFYIIGEFMHLGAERKALIWSILLPCIFVVWLIVALLYEGGHLT